MSPTPAAVQPPTPENVHLYRAAALAYRKAHGMERVKGLRDNPQPALAVWELRKEWSYIEAEMFAQRAMAWVGQAHSPWLLS
jgi:hypothetical protein